MQPVSTTRPAKNTFPIASSSQPKNISRLAWIPHTCAYRLIDEGKELFDWHHLISGSHNTIHEAGMSVIGQTESEETVPADQHLQHIVIWPGEPDVTPED